MGSYMPAILFLIPVGDHWDVSGMCLSVFLILVFLLIHDFFYSLHWLKCSYSLFLKSAWGLFEFCSRVDWFGLTFPLSYLVWKHVTRHPVIIDLPDVGSGFWKAGWIGTGSHGSGSTNTAQLWWKLPLLKRVRRRCVNLMCSAGCCPITWGVWGNIPCGGPPLGLRE